MNKLFARMVIVPLAIVILTWSLINVSFRELRRSARWVWLDLQCEWASICRSWKRGSLK